MGNNINKTIDNYGTINIILDKNYYNPGEQINGYVNLNLIKDHPSNILTMYIEGIEYYVIKETEKNKDSNGNETEDIIEYKDSRIIYSHRFNLFAYNGNIFRYGQYQFPFSFILSGNIPSSFFEYNSSFDNSEKFVIDYTISCGLFDPYKKQYFITSIPFIVEEISNIPAYTATKLYNRQLRAYCCCLNIGIMKYNVYFEKDKFHFGDEANIIVDIDNSECKVGIKLLKLKIIQNIIVYHKVKKSNYNKIIYDNEFPLQIKPFTKHLYSEGKGVILKIIIPNLDKRSSTKGMLFECNYQIVTELKLNKLTYYQNKTLTQDIKIFAKPQKNEFQNLNNWQPEVHNMNVLSLNNDFKVDRNTLINQ